MVNNNTVLFVFLFFCPLNFIFAQPDSLREDASDSIFINSIETLLEQNETEENDSPLLELLTDSAIKNETARTSLHLRSRLQEEMQQRKGFLNGDYKGSRLKSYQRIAGTYDNFSAGVLFDKDAGELQFNDFSTGYFRAKNIVDSISFLVGDYVVESGEGLILWRGFDVGKGANVLSPAHRNGRGIVPHLSSDEVYFFRGSAVTFQFSPVTFSLFFSQRKRDATIDTATHTATFYSAGYFRTENELTKRNTLPEKTFGGIAGYSMTKNISFGASFYRSQFDYTLLIREGNIFSGKNLSLGSLFFDAKFSTIKLFGEAAQSSTRASGKILGGQFFPARNFTFITVWRNYDERFFSLHGLGFGERTETSNERGIYFGVSLRPARRVNLALYYDQFAFPQPTNTIFTHRGNEVLCRAEFQQSPQLYFVLQTQKKENVVQRRFFYHNEWYVQDVFQSKYQVRFIVDARTVNGFSFRERIDFVTVKQDYRSQRNNGILLYGDIGKKLSEQISGTFRFVIFNTDSYESRVSEFEKDLTGALSIPSLYGKGIRWYIFVEWEIAENVMLQWKYSSTYRDDIKIIGTGNNAFPANTISALGMQLEWRL
jgi:hypothetical protein